MISLIDDFVDVGNSRITSMCCEVLTDGFKFKLPIIFVS